MIIKTTKSPKQIIVDHKGQAAPWPYPYDFSVRYVRADLVNGLVKALENWKNARTLGSKHLEMENIEAALKALEKSNGN